jgi:plastocyanin
MKKQITLAAAALTLTAAAFAVRTPAADAAPVQQTHVVRMIKEGDVPRFEPANITIKAGDSVRWVNTSGGPHNVSFDKVKTPDEAEPVLMRNMPNQIDELWGPLMAEPNATYTISTVGLKPGRYEYFCLPHMANQMKGTITIQ